MWDPGRGERRVVRPTESVTRKPAKGTLPKKIESMCDRETSRGVVWLRPEENVI